MTSISLNIGVKRYKKETQIFYGFLFYVIYFFLINVYNGNSV